MPKGIFRVQTLEATEQQVVIELLDQHPLGADAVDRLQQQGQQQLQRGNRRPTALGIQLEEGGLSQSRARSVSHRSCRRGWDAGMRSSVVMYENR
jgi:hypothetical protein